MSDALYRKRKSTRLRRKTRNRGAPRPVFLIVCEGEKTEPNYFRAFRVPSAHVKGAARNTLSLVEYAEMTRKRAARDDEIYDQVWCVFDRDEFDAGQFNEAVKTAERYGFRVAWSNECFELWYLLHFNYYDTAISRVDYSRKLTELIGRKYDKTDRRMYERLLDMQESAIINSRRLMKKHMGRTPAASNPCTRVHELVTELNRYQQ